MIRAIIIDDEQHCINRLTALLDAHCKQTIKVEGIFLTAGDALAGIAALQPELVFMDIQLHDMTGFDLLTRLPQINFEVIFTTVYDSYAIKAFKFSAIDYLLKPILADDLLSAVSKLRKVLLQNEISDKFDNLFHNLKVNSSTPQKIAVPTNKGLVFLQVSDIIHCQSDVNYTTIYLTDNKKLTVAKTLKEFDNILADHQFFRVHNSHIINLNCVKSYHKGDGGYVILTDNTSIEVSNRRKELFLKKIKEM